jgi:hypothetical protein
MFVHSIRNEKLFILWPVVAALRKPHLLVTERLAVSCCGVLLVR